MENIINRLQITPSLIEAIAAVLYNGSHNYYPGSADTGPAWDDTHKPEEAEQYTATAEGFLHALKHFYVEGLENKSEILAIAYGRANRNVSVTWGFILECARCLEDVLNFLTLVVQANFFAYELRIVEAKS